MAKGIEVIVCEPSFADDHYFHLRVIRDLDAFKAEAEVNLASRMVDEIADVAPKMFTRDIFWW